MSNIFYLFHILIIRLLSKFVTGLMICCNTSSQRRLYGDLFRVTMDSFRQANRAIGGIFYTRWIVHHDWVSQLFPPFVYETQCLSF